MEVPHLVDWHFLTSTPYIWYFAAYTFYASWAPTAPTMGVSPESMIAIIWGFLAFDLFFLTIRLYLVTTRHWVTKTAFAGEVCICLAFVLFLVETASTTAYQGELIKYRDDPTINKSMGMPRNRLILFFKVCRGLPSAYSDP